VRETLREWRERKKLRICSLKQLGTTRGLPNGLQELQDIIVCGLGCGVGICLLMAARKSDCHLMGYPNMRIRQMEAEFFYIVQALVHVKVGLGIAPIQIESLEGGPWSELRGQVPANLVSGKTEDTPDASKYMHLHLRSASLTEG
jgi:hypothetical protein